MYKKENGVTLSILVLTIIVLLIVSGTILINASDYLGAKRLLNMENDIKILQEELPIYYEIHGTLPTSAQVTDNQLRRMSSQLNYNDSGSYLIIDLSQLPHLKLNYGYGKESGADYYVVNTGSLSVYYLAGLNVDGTMRYTITQNNSNLSSANQRLDGGINITATSTATTIAITVEASPNITINGCKYALDNLNWTEQISGNTHTFTNLTPNTLYKINVQAIDSDGNTIIANNNGYKIKTLRVADGSYDSVLKLNTPDTSKFPVATTKYVTWEKQQNNSYREVLSDVVPDNWYDYANGKWANIKTTSEDSSLEAYWVWIPRFAYRLSETTSAQQINVIYVKNNTKVGVLADGSEVTCYYATDTTITSNNSGVYNDKSLNSVNEWIIHPAFTFGNTQLNGIWVAKYEASSNVPSAINGGGDNTALKVQVKPDVISWRGISLSSIFTVCRNIQTQDGALGMNVGLDSAGAVINTHPATNMEWSAVAILSQSNRFGIFNTTDSSVLTDRRVWNNPNINYITGTVGRTEDGPDAGNIVTENCIKYNQENGSKASTTGNIYGVYDMAGGAWEYVMAVQHQSNEITTPALAYTGFNAWPDSKYYDIYTAGTLDLNTDYDRGKIGDLTRETTPISNTGWNGDLANFVYTDEPVFVRGGVATGGQYAGLFAFSGANGSGMSECSFRPVLVCQGSDNSSGQGNSVLHDPVTETPTTFSVQANATNVTLSVVPASVGADGTTYQYSISTDGTTNWVNPRISTDTSHTFTGLTPETEYTVNVKIGDTAQTAQSVTTASQVTMKDVTTVADAIKYSATAISATDTSYSGTYKELTATDGTVKVPVGFTVRYDSASTVDGGIVVADQNDNQWVWIPVNASNTYERRDLKTNGTWSDYSETLTGAEANVSNVGGYYIARYESGVSGATAMRIGCSGDAGNAQTVSIKKDQVPYNYIKVNSSKSGSGTADATTVSANIATANSYKTGITTKLCSSHAWDTALNFIGNESWSKGTGTGYQSIRQNYSVSATFKYLKYDNGSLTTADKMTGSSDGVMLTGQGDATKNIYDMGGNCYEYTTEYYSGSDHPYVLRGGVYYNDFTGVPAGVRSYGSGVAHVSISFRPTLYL